MNVKKEKTKKDIIEKYEVGLSQTLINSGFSPAAIFQNSIDMTFKSTFLYQKKLNPFIKTSVFRGLSKLFVFISCEFIFNKFKVNYPIKYILENYKLKLLCIKDIIKSIKFLNIKRPEKLLNTDNSHIEQVLPFNIKNL